MMTTHLRRSTRLRTATLAVATLGLVYSAHLTSPPALMAQEADAVALFKKGVELFRQERYVEARDVFRRVFELDPNPFVIFNIGRCYEELGELEEAVRYYDRSLKLEGLPEQAKVEAIKRIENLEPLIQAIKTRRTAVAEAAIRVDRSFYVAQNDARKSNPLTPPVPAESRTAVTWIGVGTASLGLLALGAGFVIDRNIGDKLDEQDALVASYTTIGDEALLERDPTKANTAIEDANEVNALADEIENDQRVAAILMGAGGVLLLGGLTMVLLDTPSSTETEPPATTISVVPSPGGIGVFATW